METAVIDIANLTKTYGKARGIENVTLQIHEGEIFGFIGPNGAGKSTTIRILLNLIFPDSGSARILGMDVIREHSRIMKQVGYIPSDANAWPHMTVREFLEYCSRFYDNHDHTERINELSDLFEVDTTRRISDLSVGNKKKISILQSLIHRPKILILDEPTLGLDPLMQAKFFNLLRAENRQGVTIFFSSHILNEVQALCRRVAIIREGKIIRVEEIESLRKKQFRKVQVEFARGSGFEDLRIPGIENVNRAGTNTVSFMFTGDIDVLLKSLASLTIANLMIEEPSLEEIFMHYYQ